MSFHNDLGQIILACKAYQKEVDTKKIWFEEPYQTKYLVINKLLAIYEEQRAEIENVAAVDADAKTPDFIDLSVSRKEYFKLLKEIPPFLAGDVQSYYYLQSYNVACFKLLKDFSYSTFSSDFPKIYKLKEWFSFIAGAQDQHDSKSSIEASMDDIKKLENFADLTPLELQKLQAEVNNIQTLMLSDPEMAEALSSEDAELLRRAAEYVKQNQDSLVELPPIDNSFEYYAGPFLETAAYRCQQLIVQADDFTDDHPKAKKIKELYRFKEELKDSFDMGIPLCADIYNAIIQAIGSHNAPTTQKLCSMLNRALQPFADIANLEKNYVDDGFYTGDDIDFGMPDTFELYDCIETALSVYKG